MPEDEDVVYRGGQPVLPDRAGCNHFGALVSEPVTATNPTPEHRCADCGAVVITADEAIARLDERIERG